MKSPAILQLAANHQGCEADGGSNGYIAHFSYPLCMSQEINALVPQVVATGLVARVNALPAADVTSTSLLMSQSGLSQQERSEMGDALILLGQMFKESVKINNLKKTVRVAQGLHSQADLLVFAVKHQGGQTAFSHNAVGDNVREILDADELFICDHRPETSFLNATVIQCARQTGRKFPRWPMLISPFVGTLRLVFTRG